jgi:hypothetical protein
LIYFLRHRRREMGLLISSYRQTVLPV